MSQILQQLHYHLTSQRFQKSVVPKLHRKLLVSSPAENFSIFFKLQSVGPTTLDTLGAPVSKKVAEAPAAPTAAEQQSAYVQQLADVPEFASYGPVLNSSNPAQLTENETEYQVNCVKHIFTEHIIFQVRLLYTMIASLMPYLVQYFQHTTGYYSGASFGNYGTTIRG